MPTRTWYLAIAPKNIAMFRFLLEAYEHVGYFTVLDAKRGLLKFVCPSDMGDVARAVLIEMAESLAFSFLPSPWEEELRSASNSAL